MRYMLFRSAHMACPNCGSQNMARSHEKSVYDYLLRVVFQIKPYRCMSCDYRHFRYRPSSTPEGDALPSAPE